ncbi:MAG: hypothetical protein IT221_14970 [Fluviicola sp.]|nr:hypothetical protein [Fluviicola sp.]
MKKKTLVYFLILSLVLSILILVRINFITKTRSWESYALAIIIVLIAVLMLNLAYKGLIQRFRKGHIDHSKFAVLFDLDKRFVTGEIEFYFTLDTAKGLRFLILNQGMETIEVVKDQDYESGGHIVRFDSSKLDSGVYFYCIETDNQRTMKKFFVQHDNLTA